MCSSISALTYTLIKAVQEMDSRDELNDPPKVVIKDGCAEVSVSPRFAFRKEARLVFDTICEGYKLIANDYPHYVVLESI